MSDRSDAAAAVTALVVMGASGSGKTTIGVALAQRLGWKFADGDDFHPPANIAKMQGGTPLDDADRAPWLQAIAAQLDAWRATGQQGVVACSALKRRYRKIIIGDHADARLVYLKGDEALLARRLAARHGHFMPASLLHSQLQDLEEPPPEECAITVPIGPPPAAIVEQIVAALGEDTASR